MRFVTVNLFNGGADGSDLGRLLQRHDPDLVACQEVGFHAVRVLGRHFDHGVALPAADHTGRALVSRHPITVDEIPLPGRPALQTTIRLNGSEVCVVSAHLSNPLDGPQAIRDRAGQVEGLLAAVRDRPRVLVMGDFNATPWWPAYRRMRAELEDGVARAAAVTGTRPDRTWAIRPGRRPRLRIDHVFIRGVLLADVLVEPVRGSDHRALIFGARTS